MNKMGFGFLRLPLSDEKEQIVDEKRTCEMVDAFLEQGGTLFDTGYMYLDGKSEKALKTTLVERYPRDRFLLMDKLPTNLLEEPGDCQKYYDEQRARCGVEQFDIYFTHWLNRAHYRKGEKAGVFDFVKNLKARGETKEIGFSFHDSPEFLDFILTEHPEFDDVLLQLNYLDWESKSLRAKELYEVAARHGKRIMVMEPLKGGTLTNLPAEVLSMYKESFPGDTPASLGLRFIHSLEHVSVCFSGMHTLEQVNDNMKDFAPLTEEEKAVLKKAVKKINAATAIPCTGCRYCEKSCPKTIAIPDYFAIYNEICRFPEEGWKIKQAYDETIRKRHRLSDCVECHSCERHCPQNIEILEYFDKIKESAK